jgi:hypothetical protein
MYACVYILYHFEQNSHIFLFSLHTREPHKKSAKRHLNIRQRHTNMATLAETLADPSRPSFLFGA